MASDSGFEPGISRRESLAAGDGPDPRISRRATLKRLGAAAGFAWSVPVVTTVASRAAATGSPPPSTEPTSTTTTTTTTAPPTSTTTTTPPPRQGCTRTQGYWKNHASDRYDATWDAIGGPGAPFFDTGKSYLEILTTPPAGGNAFLILAHQWIAAELNMSAGASVPAQVQAAFQEAQGLLHTSSTSGNIPKRHADRARAIELAGTLDQYNNGNAGTPRCL